MHLPDHSPYLTGIKGARWLILPFFLIQLYGITNPPLERNQNWRQVTTNMYARNFCEVSNNILYPRVDMAGELTGITAKEFPVYNYLIYLTATVFGWQHWYGRLINLVFSCVGAWFFYLLVRKYADDKGSFGAPRPLAWPALAILLCSIWLGHSRIIMPDTFSVSLVLAGLYFGLEYLHRGRWWQFFLFVILSTVGALSKLPSGFLLVLLAVPILSRRIDWRRKMTVVLGGVVLLGACGWWYGIWLPQVVETYGFEHYPMRTFTEGMREILADLPETAERFYVSALKGYAAFGLYLAGVAVAIWRRATHLLGVFLLLSATFVGYMFKAGATFYHHNYYVIPFVPVMALLAAFAWAHVPQRWLRVLLLLAVAAEGIGNQQDAYRIHPSEMAKLQIETIADSISQRTDLVGFFEETGNPQELYFAHRKGWVLNRQQIISDSSRLALHSKGCRFIFINKHSWGNPPFADGQEAVFENDHYIVIALE